MTVSRRGYRSGESSRAGSTPGARWRAGIGLRAATTAGIVFLWFPLVLIVVYAFTTDDVVLTFPPPSYTTRWFGVAADNPEIWSSLWLSVRVALIATIIALFLGSLAAAAVARSRFFGREVVSFLVILPIALPGIVTGISLRATISVLGLGFSTWTIVIGHATFTIVIVYNNVLARLRRTSGSLVEASADLGASGWQTFRHVLLPASATALVAGAMLAFALSFDEVIVTTFTAGNQKTLPIWILGSLNRPRNRPVLNVVALVVMAVTLVPVLVAQRLAGESAGTGAGRA